MGVEEPPNDMGASRSPQAMGTLPRDPVAPLVAAGTGDGKWTGGLVSHKWIGDLKQAVGAATVEAEHEFKFSITTPFARVDLALTIKTELGLSQEDALTGLGASFGVDSKKGYRPTWGGVSNELMKQLDDAFIGVSVSGLTTGEPSIALAGGTKFLRTQVNVSSEGLTVEFQGREFELPAPHAEGLNIVGKPSAEIKVSIHPGGGISPPSPPLPAWVWGVGVAAAFVGVVAVATALAGPPGGFAAARGFALAF